MVLPAGRERDAVGVHDVVVEDNGSVDWRRSATARRVPARRRDRIRRSGSNPRTPAPPSRRRCRSTRGLPRRRTASGSRPRARARCRDPRRRSPPSAWSTIPPTPRRLGTTVVISPSGITPVHAAAEHVAEVQVPVAVDRRPLDEPVPGSERFESGHRGTTSAASRTTSGGPRGHERRTRAGRRAGRRARWSMLAPAARARSKCASTSSTWTTSPPRRGVHRTR